MLKKKVLVIVVLLFLLTSCYKHHSPSFNIGEWKEDLLFLKKELILRDIVFSLPTNEIPFYFFSDQVDNMIKKLNEYKNEDEIKLDISRAIASLHQVHTQLVLPNEKVIPLLMYMQDNKLYVIDTISEYPSLLHQQVTEINGAKVDELVPKIKELISAENEQGFLKGVPSYIMRFSVLHGLGIVNINDEEVTVITQSNEGKESATKIKFVHQEDSSHKLIEPNKKSFLNKKHSDGNYSYEVINKDNVIYIAYNYCEEDSKYPIKQLTEEIREEVKKHPNYKVILDLRNNPGGNSSVIHPLFNMLFSELNFKGEDVRVLLSRYSASSAILNALELKVKHRAILVGEPPNGDILKPGEKSTMSLPNSGLEVSYSTKIIENYNQKSLVLDQRVDTTIQDYMNGKDHVYEAAVRYKK